MKKFLTKFASLALVFVCFFAVGCTSDIVISKKALAACQKYLADLETLDATISADEYVYPIADAQAAAKAVSDTDLSKYGVAYSNYNDFEFEGDANGHSMFSPKILYPGAIGVLTNLKKYIDYFDTNEFKIDTTYKFMYETPEYFRATFSNNTLKVYIEKVDFFAEWTIKLAKDSSNWTSLVRKAVGYREDGSVEYYHHYALEKSTSESRIFDRCACINWRKNSAQNGVNDQINSIDFQETTQKMLFVDDSFVEGFPTGVSATLQAYMESLDFESFVGCISKKGAITVSISTAV